MSQSSPNLFAVIDFEATGGKPSESKIMEVGIVITDGHNIISRYEKLINPKRHIDYYVAKLTGINDKMVSNQPTFESIHHEILDLINNKIIVAHNVDFDYHLLQQELMPLGIMLDNQILCTVKLAKKLFPGLPAYNLKHLSEHFGIQIDVSHRALADAEATAKLFHIMIDKAKETLKDSNFDIFHEINEQRKISIPSHWQIDENLAKSSLSSIAYFYSDEETLLDIAFFYNTHSGIIKYVEKNQSQSNLNKISRVELSITPIAIKGELLALHQIQILAPLFSKPFKKRKHTTSLSLIQDDKGIYHFDIAPLKTNDQYQYPFLYCTTYQSAEKYKKRFIYNTSLKNIFFSKPIDNPKEEKNRINKLNAAMLDCFKDRCCDFKNGYYIFSKIGSKVEGVTVQNFYIHSWFCGQIDSHDNISDINIEWTFDHNYKITQKFLSIIYKRSFQKIIT